MFVQLHKSFSLSHTQFKMNETPETLSQTHSGLLVIYHPVILCVEIFVILFHSVMLSHFKSSNLLLELPSPPPLQSDVYYTSVDSAAFVFVLSKLICSECFDFALLTDNCCSVFYYFLWD